MASPEAFPEPLRSPSSAELQRLWEGGQRGRALRGGLDNWQSLMAKGDDLGWLQTALRSCGLGAEAFALQAWTTRRRGDVREWEALIRSVLHSGDPWWARELLDDAGSGSRALQALRIEVELVLGGDASALIAAWVLEHRDEAGQEAAVEWWARSGRVEEAERLLGEMQGSTLWRARFALWRRQTELARALLEGLPSSPAARCLAAVAAVQEGRLAEAESQLRALLDGEAQAEAWSWLATVLRKQGRYAEAVKAADAAAAVSLDSNFVLWLERALAADCARSGPSQTGDASLLTRLLNALGYYSGHARVISELEHARAVYPLGLKPEDPIRALEPLIERFAGNHTSHPTMIERGRLTACPLPLDPGQLGAQVQLVQQTRGAAAARALFRELTSRLNDPPRLRIYQGEMELWMGDYEAAAQIFRAVLRRRRDMKWAWIGLGASAMLQGDLRRAQQIWRKGVSLACAGPTLYVYRGECYRRQGKHTAARRDLELAVRQKPQRLSAWINLALLDGGPHELDRIERKCMALAPLLMEGLGGTPAEKLEQVLGAMRGNRSSSRATYHLWGRVWNLGLAESD